MRQLVTSLSVAVAAAAMILGNTSAFAAAVTVVPLVGDAVGPVTWNTSSVPHVAITSPHLFTSPYLETWNGWGWMNGGSSVTTTIAPDAGYSATVHSITIAAWEETGSVDWSVYTKASAGDTPALIESGNSVAQIGYGDIGTGGETITLSSPATSAYQVQVVIGGLNGNVAIRAMDLSTAVVPEPASLAFLGGVAGLGLIRRRRA